jgi:hypothetical protein
MKSIISFIAIISILPFLTACGQLINDIAKDDLLGNYSGTVTYIAHMSEYNIGLEDNVRKEKCQVSIQDFDGLVTFKMSGLGTLRLNNITAATNGSGFNIPEQSVILEDGTSGKFKGLNECFVGESRCDGFLNTETNVLEISFKGIIPFEMDGYVYDTPLSASLKLKKAI